MVEAMLHSTPDEEQSTLRVVEPHSTPDEEQSSLRVVEPCEQSPLGYMTPDIFVKHSVSVLAEVARANGSSRKDREIKQFLGTLIRNLIGSDNEEVPSNIENSDFRTGEYRDVVGGIKIRNSSTQ